MRNGVARALLMVATVLLVSAAGCENEKVPKPSSDSTLPTLRWHVENRNTGAVTDHYGSGVVTGKKGDYYRVTLFAKDPEGIYKITIGAGTQKGCSGVSNGEPIGSVGFGLGAVKSQTFGPDGAGNVLTRIFMIESYTPDTTCTNEGGVWSYFTFHVAGSGTNFFNGTTNGLLTITVTA